MSAPISASPPGATSAAISRRIFVFLVVLDVLYLVNCLSPFLGLKFENSQAMYSQLDARARNHLVLPPLPVFGEAVYVRDVEIELPPELADEAAGLQWFTSWANRTGHSLHLQFFDHHFARLCEAAPGARIGLRYTAADGSAKSHDDVCAEPELRDPFPIGLYPACDPECYGELEVWASGRWRSSGIEGVAP